MLKMFTTQLIGLMNGIRDRENFIIEDAARLLSQALVGDGSVYVYGKGEMGAVTAEALYGKERLPKVLPLLNEDEIATLHTTDRVILITRTSTDEEVLAYAKKLRDKKVPFVVISSIDEEDKRLVELADVHLDLKVTASLVPTDDGKRIGFPASLVALYTYFCLFCLMTDILSEYE